LVQRHAPGLVADRLTELAQQEASGALQVDGDPGGIIYLSDGRLAFAESEIVPDLGARLVNSRRLRVDQWRRAQYDSQPDGSAGDLLLRRGLLDAAEWQTLVRSAALDALLALASQLVRARAAACTCFVPHRAQRVGPALGLDIGSAWDDAWQEAVRLACYDVAPDARLQLRGRSRLVFGREASAVLGQMDGRATIRDLAWRNGLALFAMMDWAARLVQDGVCAITGPEYAAARQQSAAIRHQHAAVQWTPPDLGLLGRVLTRLRQLD
jgi:hypothetical protein